MPIPQALEASMPEAKRDEVPLPEPHGYVGSSGQYCLQPPGSPLMPERSLRYTADQLREYGRQCVLAAQQAIVAAQARSRCTYPACAGDAPCNDGGCCLSPQPAVQETHPVAAAGVQGEAVKLWPFVESLGDFTERFKRALFPTYLEALRNVLIENPPALSAEYVSRAIRPAPAVERGVTLAQVEDALADACLGAEIPDSKFESLSIALRAALSTAGKER